MADQTSHMIPDPTTLDIEQAAALLTDLDAARTALFAAHPGLHRRRINAATTAAEDAYAAVLAALEADPPKSQAAWATHSAAAHRLKAAWCEHAATHKDALAVWHNGGPLPVLELVTRPATNSPR